MRKTTRQLQHSKSSKVQVGTGAPSNTEGQSGDLTLRLTKSGIKLFAKFRDKWYLVGQGNLNQLGGDKEDKLFSDNKEKITTISKKGKVEVKDKAELRLFPWSIQSKKFSGGWATAEKGLVFEQLDKSQSFSIFESGEIVFQENNSALYPQFTLKNTQNSQGGPWLNFYHDDADPTLTASGIGQINFDGNNDAGERISYAIIQSDIKDVADGDERGNLSLYVADEAGDTTTGILIQGQPSSANYIKLTNADVIVSATKKLRLDGSPTGDTYIEETSADILDFYVGNANVIKITEDTADKVEINGADLEIDATQKLYLDGGGNTYITEASADVLAMYSGGNNVFAAIGGTDTSILAQRTVHITPDGTGGGGGYIGLNGNTVIPTTKKLYLDSGTDTYIHEVSADALDFVVGGITMLHLDEANGQIDIAADAIRLTDEDGSAYSGSVESAIQTKAQIDAARVTHKTEVSLSQAECTALHSTEITLVAAQGANQVVIPTSVICFVDRAATQTSSAVEAFVGWNGANTLGTTLLFVRRFMWNEGGDRIIQLTRINEIGQSLTAGDNQPVTIKLDSAITTDSFTGMKVVTTYHVYDNS